MRHNLAKGFTLLEVLIATVVVVVGVVTAVGLFANALVGSLDAEKTTIAMHLAQKRIEEIRNLDFDTEIVNEAKAAVSGFFGFEREVVVTEPESDLKQVAVTVYWSYKGDEVDVPLVTYISKN